MSAIISFHVEPSGQVSISDLDLKIHDIFETKEEAISQMRTVVDKFVEKCNKEKGLEKVNDVSDLKNLKDGYNFSKPDEGNNYSMWVKYSKPGRIYGKSHKSKRIRLFVILDIPIVIPEAPVAPEVVPPKTQTKPKIENESQNLSLEEKHYANYGAMIVELQEKLRERQERRHEGEQKKQETVLNADSIVETEKEQEEETEIPLTPAPSPVSCHSLMDEKELFDQFVEEAVKELTAFDFIEQQQKDDLVERGWKVFMNPMFNNHTSVTEDQSDDDIYYNIPVKKRCSSYDADVDEVSDNEWSSTFSSSDDEVYYIMPKQKSVVDDESISYSEFFDSSDEDDDEENDVDETNDEETELLSSFSWTEEENEEQQSEEQYVEDPLPITQEFYSYAPQQEPQHFLEYAQVDPIYEGYVNPFNSYLPYDTTFEPSLTTPLLTPEQQMDSYDYYNNYPVFQQQPMPYDEGYAVERHYKMFQDAIEEWRNTYTGQMDYTFWPESTPMVPKKGKNVW